MRTKSQRIFLVSSLALFTLSTVSLATSSTSSDNESAMTAEVKNVMRSIDEVKRLPISGMSLINAGDKLFLVSDNGHFILAGDFKLLDMWRGKLITSMDDTHGIDKVDLRKIGLNPDELSTLAVGHGKREVTIFLDPQCTHCHELLTQLPSLYEDYTFKLVLIPVLGSQSAELVKQLMCNGNRQQSIDSVFAQDFSKLPPLVRKEGSCDLGPLQKAVVATKLLDITGVPFSFLPSHNTFKGSVKSFKALLEKDRDDEIHGR